MKILLIIYAISWLIIFIVYITFYIINKIKKEDVRNKNPWYSYVLFLLLAPLVVVFLPFVLYSAYKSDKGKKEQKEKLEWKERREMKRKEALKNAFLLAKQSQPKYDKKTYIDIAYKLEKIVHERKYQELLVCLDKIQETGDRKLNVQECEEKGIGDESKLYIELNDGKRDYDIFKHLIVEDSPMGAWQAYWLYTLWHILPMFWHGLYGRRDYLFQFEDVFSIKLEEDANPADRDKLLDTDLSPEVIGENGDYYVSCCYWTQFGGLIREHVYVNIKGNKVVEIKEFLSETKYEYDCGYCY